MFPTVTDAVPTICVNLVRLCFVALVSQHPADNMTDWADRTGWCSSDFICALAASAGSKKAKRAQCPADQLACSVGDGYEVSDRSHSARRRLELNGFNCSQCIDAQTNLEQCGGCASDVEGQDCTAIFGVESVTCQQGQCVVGESTSRVITFESFFLIP